MNLDEQIFIRKQAGKKKDAIRVSREEDIPENLKGAIKIVDIKDIPERFMDVENANEKRKNVIEKIKQDGLAVCLDCVEGTEYAPLGSVIGYEKSNKTASGINTWHIANAATNLVEENGVFYTKATVLPAQRVGEELPKFMEGTQIFRNEDGSWTVITSWGQSTGYPGEAYFIRYGTREDGTPSVNILTKSEESYNAYYVCDENGNIIAQLSQIDPYIEKDNTEIQTKGRSR